MEAADLTPSDDQGAPDRRRRQLLTLTAATLVAPALLRRAWAAPAMPMSDMSHMSGMPGMSDMPGMAPPPPQAPLAARATPFQRALPVPARLLGETTGETRQYRLQARAGSHALIEGLATPTWGFNGDYLGPALIIPRGQAVHIQVQNTLAQSLSTHWHGALVTGDMDGGPHSAMAAHSHRDYRFTLDQPGATLWYHPHTENRAGAQTYAGLAGMLIVDDGVDRKLGLPHTWGVDDIPLILQDRRIAASGQLLYMTAGMTDLMGMKGDRFLVNGCEQPYATVPAQALRLRVLNASNARVYNLALSDQRDFSVIASDQGLLARPVATKTLLLAPGERVEIVIDLSRDQGKTLTLLSRSGMAVPQLGSSADDSDHWDHGDIALLQLRVVSPNGAPARVPAMLTDIEPLPQSGATVRRVTLQGMNQAAMMHKPAHLDLGAAPASGPGGMSLGVAGLPLFSLNQRVFNMKDIDYQVRLGSHEIWAFVNDQEMAHPMHVHGVAFQVLSRNGLSPPAWEQGWKDTVLVGRGETVRVGMRFTKTADAAQPFMFHCHILEHEENGMMGQFTVT